MDTAQWRFASLAAAEREAKRSRQVSTPFMWGATIPLRCYGTLSTVSVKSRSHPYFNRNLRCEPSSNAATLALARYLGISSPAYFGFPPRASCPSVS